MVQGPAPRRRLGRTDAFAHQEKPVETRANHVLIGLFTLMGLAVLLAVGLWSANYQAETGWQEYEIRFEQAVSGLSVGSVVQYNGINMGSVRGLRLAPDNPRQVQAIIRLIADAPVREDTVARLSVSGLTGVAFIQLRGGSPESPRLEASAGQTRPVILAEESPLQRLIDASEDIATTTSEALLRTLDFLTDDNAQSVARILANVDRLSEQLVDDAEGLPHLMGQANEVTQQLNAVLARLDQVLISAGDSLDSIDQHLIEILPEVGRDLASATADLATISARLDRVLADNEQALSEFGVESLSQFGPTLQEFRHLIRELSRLGNRFERHPTRFLLGGDQPEEYQPQ